MAIYQLMKNGGVKYTDPNTNQEYYIPNDPANTDWQEYLAWEAIEGNDADPIPVPSLESVKTKKIEELRNDCQNVIVATYPLWKQIDIISLQGHTQQEQDDMWTFINGKRDLCNSKEIDVNACGTNEAVAAITFA